MNADEEACEQHFQLTHSRDRTGRYVVRLPLKSAATVLGDSEAKARAYLKRLYLQFSTKPVFQQLYSDFITEYERLGHMVRTKDDNPTNSTIHYLPHHGVLREGSRTTKLRVVFNGSSRTSSGKSLNDILYPGAKLQTDILDILIWSRIHRILFTTDIVKMFRQIAVHPDDWDLQRILWREEDGELIKYQLTTVSYGLTCAPFLALRTLQQLITDEGHRFPKAVIPLTKGRYVDDIFGGADNPVEAKDIIHQVKQLCEAGGFPLQKWNSNDPEIVPSNNDSPSVVEIEPTHTKILGLVWNPDSDTFHFSSSEISTAKLTKRTIASEIARLYDPLGLISPILIKAKSVLQELWLLKTDWDETIPPDLRERWISFRAQLPQLEQLSIPRWLGTIHSNLSVEIHGFSDASQIAMAAALYMRVLDGNDRVSVRLLCSKTKVAPLKRLTIPRLELSAALLLARLVKQTQKALELPEAAVFCWSDSSVALTWINSHPARWKEFVSNRVSAIQELLPTGSWRFVSGKENPADCASRGLTPEQLKHHDIWWNGPRWLSGPSVSWPNETLIRAPIQN